MVVNQRLGLDAKISKYNVDKLYKVIASGTGYAAYAPSCPLLRTLEPPEGLEDIRLPRHDSTIASISYRQRSREYGVALSHSVQVE